MLSDLILYDVYRSYFFFFTDNDMSDDHDDDTDDDDDDLLPAYQHKDPTSVYCHAVHVSPR